jgi:hypothetical protein
MPPIPAEARKIGSVKYLSRASEAISASLGGGRRGQDCDLLELRDHEGRLLLHLLEIVHRRIERDHPLRVHGLTANEVLSQDSQLVLQVVRLEPCKRIEIYPHDGAL